MAGRVAQCPILGKQKSSQETPAACPQVGPKWDAEKALVSTEKERNFPNTHDDADRLRMVP